MTSSISLHKLPSEVLWTIVSYLSLQDLATARHTCKRIQQFCDHPRNWRAVKLEPPPKSSQASPPSGKNMTLWQLNDLKHLIGPHLAHIESIQIWGVRDNIVLYLLSNCPRLKDLTVCGWMTLSNHAFKLTRKHALRRLELIGASNLPNYAAIDAGVLGQLLTHCPDLSELVLGCQVHIHAKTLIQELRKCSAPLQLRYVTFATRRTWSQRHVAELMRLLPTLERMCLLPAAAKGFDLKNNNKQDVHRLMMMGKHHVALGAESEEEDEEFDMTSDMIIHRCGSLDY